MTLGTVPYCSSSNLLARIPFIVVVIIGGNIQKARILKAGKYQTSHTVGGDSRRNERGCWWMVLSSFVVLFTVRCCRYSGGNALPRFDNKLYETIRCLGDCSLLDRWSPFLPAALRAILKLKAIAIRLLGNDLYLSKWIVVIKSMLVLKIEENQKESVDCVSCFHNLC